MRPMTRQAFLLVLALVAPAASARAAARGEPDPRALRAVAGHGMLAGLSERRVLFDQREDALWALGDDYKAGFGREGACFVPFLGSDAPANVPLHLRLASVRAGASELDFARDVAPRREGASVLYERGSVLERYDLAPGGVEQSFLVRERIGAGALLLELEVESELAGTREGSDLVFRGERGGVRYSGAVVVDARGERVAAPTCLRRGRIAIELGEPELARLRFPLLVDPLLSTFNVVPPTVLDGSAPDVAFDETTGWWCLVFERAFSAADHDIFSLRLDGDGNVLWDSVIDASGVSWTTPRVAVNRAASQILVVASTGPSGARDIQGRTQSAFVLATSGVIAISPSGADDVLPDVGGDGSTSATSYYCVVWQRNLNSSNSDVMRQMVRTDATLLGTTSMLSSPSSTLESAPSISNSNGSAGAFERYWTVAWQRFSLLDSDLYAARIAYNGVVDVSAFALDTTASNTRYPSVSSPTQIDNQRVLVAYMRGSVGSTRIHGYLVQGGSVLQHVDLSDLTSAPDQENHLYPTVDCDGGDFVLAHTQSFPSSSLYGVYVSTISVLPDRLALAEGQLSVGASGSSAPLPRLACASAMGGPRHRALLAWHWEGFGPNPTLFGSLYDASPFTVYCEPGASGVMPCPCGNAPSGAGRGCDNSSATGGARLTASGDVAPDTVTLTAGDMKPSALCLLVQSTAFSVPYAFGDGVLCVTGPTLRMGAKAASGGQASWPGPAEPSLSARSAALGDTIPPGRPRYYFVYYRDPDTGFGCAPTFNTTNSMMVRW